MGTSGFDVVVIGAGAAGCVVGARLAEATSRSVLLLEAGPDFRADPPASLRDAWHITREFDWGDTAQSDGAEAGEPVRRAKVVGGTSSSTDAPGGPSVTPSGLLATCPSQQAIAG